MSYFSIYGHHLKPSQKPGKIVDHRITMKDTLHWICRMEKEKVSFSIEPHLSMSYVLLAPQGVITMGKRANSEGSIFV